MLRGTVFAAGFAALAIMFAPVPALSVEVCAEEGSTLRLDVSFDAWFEHGVIVQRMIDGARVYSFNNHYGRGAGGEWNAGAGSCSSGRLTQTTCYMVLGFHKPGPANPNLRWQPSRVQVFGSAIGFEDSDDNDFNDAFVRIDTVGPPPIITP